MSAAVSDYVPTRFSTKLTFRSAWRWRVAGGAEGAGGVGVALALAVARVGMALVVIARRTVRRGCSRCASGTGVVTSGVASMRTEGREGSRCRGAGLVAGGGMFCVDNCGITAVGGPEMNEPYGSRGTNATEDATDVTADDAPNRGSDFHADSK